MKVKNNNNISIINIIIVLTFLIVSIILFIKFFSYQKIKHILGILKKDIKQNLFFPVYKYFENENWPIISLSLVNKNTTESILNVAYPDKSICYYAISFSTKENVTLHVDIPTERYFWSLTIYEENGKVFSQISDADIDQTNITQTQQITMGKDLKIPPGSNYCLIQRIYKVSPVTKVDDLTYPTIEMSNDRQEKPIINNNDRKSNSNALQAIFYKLFTLKFKKLNISNFFKVDVTKFFLPAEDELSLVFPNPYAKYLMVFPSNNNDDTEIKIQGKLPPNVGLENDHCRFISFMASNFYTTATDDSISFSDFTTTNNEYKLIVKKKPKTNNNTNNNANNNTNDDTNVIYWNESNPKPVLVFRVVSVAKKHNNQDILFTLNNATTTLSMENLKNVDMTYIPKVVDKFE